MLKYKNLDKMVKLQKNKNIKFIQEKTDNFNRKD